MTKRFDLQAKEIERLIPLMGACIATDKITVDGNRVGYMYRCEPSRPDDSGWCFTAGFESEEYMDDPNNSAIYEVNTIANYDPTIIPYLNASIGTAWFRAEGKDEFTEEEFIDEEE